MRAAGLAWRVEETCRNAWPALRQVLLGGWVLGFSEGLTRRANSANPLAVQRRDADAVIAGCEALYAHHRQSTIFRLPSLIESALDERLAARGYRSEGPSLVLYGEIGALVTPRDPAVGLLPRPGAQWLDAMARLHCHTAADADLYRRIVDRLAVPAAFAALCEDGGIAALGYAANHNGMVCYQSLVTDPARQRRGHARRIIASLAGWAADRGATGACLEVEAGNAPARALYAALGFEELYRYHYRRQPSVEPD
jgi:N-acetylglutamate synthase